MQRSRLEHLSLYYFIKDAYLAKQWAIDAVDEPLVFDTRKGLDGSVPSHYRVVSPEEGAYSDFFDTGSPKPYLPTTKGRGWLYFKLKEEACSIVDPSSGQPIRPPKGLLGMSYSIPMQQEDNYIVVRDENGFVIPREQYRVDYRNGRIGHFYPGGDIPPDKIATSGTPTTVDYKFHYVSLLDGWPEDANPAPLPFIAVYPDMQSPEVPWQIGPGEKYNRKFIIDVFARNNGEKEDLLDGLRSALRKKHAPVLDFNRTGEPLTPRGMFNNDFLHTFDVDGKQYQTYLTLNPGNGSILYFSKLEIMYNIAPRITRSDSERFRGRIILLTETCSDRGIDSTGGVIGSVPLGGYDSLRTQSYSS